MKFHHNDAVFLDIKNIPLEKTTHLGIGAHQDDLEIMSLPGIMECKNNPKLHFTGVTCTNGAGCARSGLFADFTDEQMQKIRQEEQNEAARKGDYLAMFQLLYSSTEVKSPYSSQNLVKDLKEIIKKTRPEVIYTHNLADKHLTHIGVVISVIQALRELDDEYLPRKFYGCEVWRNLDWVPDSLKVVLPVQASEESCRELLGVYKSQIAGGKRYDLASIGRMHANATFLDAHQVDTFDFATYAIDLLPLVTYRNKDIEEYICDHIDLLKKEIQENIFLRMGC